MNVLHRCYTCCSVFTKTTHRLVANNSRRHKSRRKRDLHCTDNNISEPFMDGTLPASGMRLHLDRMVGTVLKHSKYLVVDVYYEKTVNHVEDMLSVILLLCSQTPILLMTFVSLGVNCHTTPQRHSVISFWKHSTHTLVECQQFVKLKTYQTTMKHMQDHFDKDFKT